MTISIAKAPAPRKKYDSRHPLYLGDWERAIPAKNDDTAVDDMDEPHIKRKLTILRKYPEVRKLYGYDTRTILLTATAVSVQLSLVYIFGNYSISWPWMVLCAYVIGGSITQLLGLIMHETAHNLAAPTPFQNRLVGLLANMGLAFPIAMSFKRYHLIHHAFQGVEGKDPDLPMKWEVAIIKNSPLIKLLWMSCYPVLYVLRGLAMQKQPTFCQTSALKLN